MQPRRRPCKCRVVKAPRFCAKLLFGGLRSTGSSENADSIERCASCKRVSRSRGLYSATGADTTGPWSDSGDIVALPAPAQNEGPPAPAFLCMPVDLGPKGNKVVYRRNQRQAHHHPDGKQRNGMHGKIKEVPGQVCPMMI